MKIETRALLASAYTVKAGQTDYSALTHSVVVDENGVEVKILCGKAKIANVCDPCAADVTAAPTCELCAKRLAKLVVA